MQAKGPSSKYLARARALAEAADVAVIVQAKLQGADRSPAEYERWVKDRARELAETSDLPVALRSLDGKDENLPEFALWTKEMALRPEPPFANMRSLASLEEAFFTAWNEGAGEHVERFWQLVAERGLPFQRKDIVREVLVRGRIKTESEYQAITDAIVVQQQIGKITGEEADQLAAMLEQFERRAGAKRPRFR